MPIFKTIGELGMLFEIYKYQYVQKLFLYQNKFATCVYIATVDVILITMALL